MEMEATDLKYLETAIAEYIEKQPEDWKWGNGQKIFSKEETLRLFKNDKKFRSMILKESVLLGIDLFKKG